MEGMLSTADALDRLARHAGKGVGWVIIPLILTIMFDVITRKLDFVREYFADITMETGYSISFLLQDAQWHMHAVILMFTFGFGYLANAHVRVDIFREMLSRRGQARLELVLLLILALPFLLIMIRYSFDFAYISWRQGEGSESLTGIGQRWIVKTSMLLGFLVLLAAIVATILRLWVDLRGTNEQQQEALERLEIFSDESDELEAARLQAEAALEAEKRAHGR
jgi:TRAP-type mannitol/chloroaromatic compound transport system permease small subunit